MATEFQTSSDLLLQEEGYTDGDGSRGDDDDGIDEGNDDDEEDEEEPEEEALYENPYESTEDSEDSYE